MLKKLGLFNVILFGLVFAVVLYALPRKSENLAAEYSAICSVVETTSPFYVQNCRGFGTATGNPNPSSSPYYQQTSLNNPSAGDASAWYAACDVVERTSPYYLQNCMGYRSGNTTPTNNYYNTQPSYNNPYSYNTQNYGSGSDQNSWLAACDVVERTSPYYLQNCIGYRNGNASYAGNYTYPQNNNYPPGSYTTQNGYVCMPQQYAPRY